MPSAPPMSASLDSDESVYIQRKRFGQFLRVLSLDVTLLQLVYAVQSRICCNRAMMFLAFPSKLEKHQDSSHLHQSSQEVFSLFAKGYVYVPLSCIGCDRGWGQQRAKVQRLRHTHTPYTALLK
eukprot:111462-Amphidinium_carterae.1